MQRQLAAELDRAAVLKKPIVNVKGFLGLWYARPGNVLGLKPHQWTQLKKALEDVHDPRHRGQVGRLK